VAVISRSAFLGAAGSRTKLTFAVDQAEPPTPGQPGSVRIFQPWLQNRSSGLKPV
jgi:hypothetical protein